MIVKDHFYRNLATSKQRDIVFGIVKPTPTRGGKNRHNLKPDTKLTRKSMNQGQGFYISGWVIFYPKNLCRVWIDQVYPNLAQNICRYNIVYIIYKFMLVDYIHLSYIYILFRQIYPLIISLNYYLYLYNKVKFYIYKYN